MSHAYSVININKLNVYVELVKCSVPTRNRTILINGALATSSSFRNWKRFLADKSDVITFDLPFSGKSKPYNEQDCNIVTLDDEVAIIREIISIYKPNIIASASWGGASTLKLLNNGEDGLEHAIIASYSFEFNDRMRTYVKQANLYSKEKKFVDLAHLMNEEVGAYLPNKMKFCNFRHLTTLDEIEYRQGASTLSKSLIFAIMTTKVLSIIRHVSFTLSMAIWIFIRRRKTLKRFAASRTKPAFIRSEMRDTF
ncbi:alpha/beta fold hydrolase [Pantoea ananatis]